MTLLDKLKRQAQQAVRSAVAEGANTLAEALQDTAEELAKKKYTVTFSALPTTLAALQQLPEAALSEPHHAAALAVAALCAYPQHREAAEEMLAYLQGPRGITGYDKQFLADRFRGKDYVPRSYFEGAAPQNGYTPAQPYTVTFFENAHSRDNFDEGYITLWVQSGGADNPREVKLRHKPSAGKWYLWEQFLLADIRTPAEADPWA
ncbi:MAG: hypothetical protein IJP01_02280 [Oscillospiraceae bacterium]|nr:hypothetical protein [Oscillospiraceae bacterium]